MPRQGQICVKHIFEPKNVGLCLCIPVWRKSTNTAVGLESLAGDLASRTFFTTRFSGDLRVLLVHLHVRKQLNVCQNYTGHARRLDHVSPASPSATPGVIPPAIIPVAHVNIPHLREAGIIGSKGKRNGFKTHTHTHGDRFFGFLWISLDRFATDLSGIL